MAESVDAFVEWVTAKCKSSKTGYSNTYRYGETNPNTGLESYDCSGLVYAGLKANGWTMPEGCSADWNTTTMITYLPEMGFKQISGKKLKPGDIGVSTYNDLGSNMGHTEVCYTGGKAGSEAIFMGAHSPSSGLGIDNYYATFTHYYRWTQDTEDYTFTAEYSLEVVSAVCGNMWQESHINPNLWEGATSGSWTDYSKGYGLGQWTNWKNPSTGAVSWRLRNFHDWMVNNNYNVFSGNGQMKYLIHENYWSSSGSAYSSLDEYLHSDSTDLKELTREYLLHWEINLESLTDQRYAYAQQCYDYISEHYNDTTIKNWNHELNSWLTEEEILHNAVKVYRFFNGKLQQSETTTEYAEEEDNAVSDTNEGQRNEITLKKFWQAMSAKGTGGNVEKIHIINRRLR